jgi:hypothetical protein
MSSAGCTLLRMATLSAAGLKQAGGRDAVAGGGGFRPGGLGQKERHEPSPTWQPTNPPALIAHRSAAPTRRRPSAKYAAVERRRANGEDASRSNRSAVGRRVAGRRAASAGSGRSPAAAIAASVAIPAAGLAITAVPTSRPSRSRMRIARTGTSTISLAAVAPLDMKDTAAGCAGDSRSTMSCSAGCTSSRS